MKRIYLLPLLLLCLGWASCLRPSDSDILSSHSAPFENGSIVTALSKEASLKMFNQAFQRLDLVPLIDSARGYTIFAPTDSAFIAAGYTQERLNALSDDSLRKLIMYHIVTTTLDDKALEGSAVSLKLSTLRSDTSFDPATGYTVKAYTLYALESGDLFMNGYTVPKAGTVITASNGNIFPISKVISALPNRFLWDVITKEPDLSLYRTAIEISDSMKVDYFTNLFGDVAYDSLLRTAYWYDRPPTGLSGSCLPTLFAPTNKAFNDAGVYNYDDLLQIATSGERYGYDDNYVYFNFSPLDTMMARVTLYNQQLDSRLEGFPVSILYGDLTRPAINNGVYNVYYGKTTNFLYSPLILNDGLQFSVNNGIASMTWHNKTIIIPHDADARKSVYNFMTSYGALYKIDALYYPTR